MGADSKQAGEGVERAVRLAAIAALWTLALLGGSACPKEPAAPEGACDASAQCPDGWLCVEGVCAKACNRNPDCPRRDQVCTNGACVVVPDAACDADGDCRSPNDCQLAEGAACRAGVCVYASTLQGEECDDEDLCTERDACDGEGHCQGVRTLCDSRPAAECVDGNSVYRSYADRGVCLPANGECSYAPLDVACAGCATACLGPCASLSCEDGNGGCRRNGRCVPGNPPTCAYDLAEDGAACDLASDPVGSQAGHCVEGVCSGCRVDADCREPPGEDVECFTASCETTGCAYTPRPGDSCGQPTCRAGYAYPYPLCDNDGVCLDGNRVSCNGLRCNAAGTACLTRCSSDSDCMPGAFCNVGSGVCEGLLDDGEDCSTAGSLQCLSGYCDGQRCCAGGDCCNLASDCPASYTVAPRCLDLTLATSCQGTRDVAACVDHVCTRTAVDDDSACAGALHACPANLAPLACAAAVEQPPPQCPASCGSGAPCATGYQCESGQCARIPGLGDPCTGTGQGTCPLNFKCENGVCCSANGPACCTAATSCAGALACDLTFASCRTTCTTYSSSACADPVGAVCVNNACTPKLARGLGCSDPAQCLSGFCAGGVCCDRECGQPCEACRATMTGLGDGTCGNRVDGHVCRGAVGVCDLAETCAGSSPSCPADLKSTAECRAASGDCDVAEVCDGSSNTCPTLDRVKASGDPCRAANGLCDVADTCDGSSKTCADAVKASGEPCRAKNGVCDRADFCNGSSKTCDDAVEPSTTPCRAAVHPVCDTAENCNGGKDCPNDVVASWHSDCGVCDWCESGQCVANSSDHGDCGFCEKCSSGSCVAAGAGEDPRGDDCPLLTCSNYVYGWNAGTTQCLRYAGATAQNGTCNGSGSCEGPTTACTGQGAVLVTCDLACSMACPTGASATSFDVAAEVCFTDYAEHGCGYQWACDAGGFCVYTGSCPVLYAWDGAAYAFEADIFPSGKLGLKMGYGFRKPYPHDAYLLRSEPQEIAPGALELRLVEERHETDYMDQAILYAVDVPVGLTVFSSLVNTPGPYLSPTALLHTVAAELAPPGAATLLGEDLDVRPTIAASDHESLMLSEDNNHCEWHTLELDLGDLGAAPQIKLIVDAKTVFPTSIEGYAWKNALDPTGLSTRLEVLDSQGLWVEVPRTVATLARPKEFPRPGVTDLSQIFLTADYRIRISYLMKTYVDAIWIDTTADQPLTAFEVPTVSAVLDYYGYSAQSNPSDDFEFVYGQLADRYLPLFPGAYTRYGEVTPLLTSVDDLFVIFGQGDQITLRFVAPPPPEPGSHRRYLLYSNGYYKSAKNADIAHLVEPLPFAAMSNFPYDEAVEHYPDDPEHRAYLESWNTRVEPP